MSFKDWFSKQGYSDKYKFYCYEAWCAALECNEAVATSNNSIKPKMPSYEEVSSAVQREIWSGGMSGYSVNITKFVYDYIAQQVIK